MFPRHRFAGVWPMVFWWNADFTSNSVLKVGVDIGIKHASRRNPALRWPPAGSLRAEPENG